MPLEQRQGRCTTFSILWVLTPPRFSVIEHDLYADVAASSTHSITTRTSPTAPGSPQSRYGKFCNLNQHGDKTMTYTCFSAHPVYAGFSRSYFFPLSRMGQPASWYVQYSCAECGGYESLHIPADPKGEQLKELQLLFRRMLRGEVRVQMDPTSQLLGIHDMVTEDEWARALPHAFVWIDFCW